MKFYNLNKIMNNINIHNKYLLTTIVAERARQICSSPAASKQPSGDEKSISLALADMEAGNVYVKLENDNIPDAIESEISAENTKQLSSDPQEDSQEEPQA